MQLSLERDNHDRTELGIIYGLIAIFALATARFLPVLQMLPACAFKSITGFPCPTCGSTRSLVHLAAGNMLSALLFNPLFFVVVTTAVIFFFCGLFRLLFSLPRLALHLSEREKLVFRVALVLAVLFNWAYLLLNP